MGLLSNRISRESLKAGDHIYSWRKAYFYSHHGIYVGDNKVIHFTRGEREVGTGTALDFLLLSSGPARYEIPCPDCNQQEDGNGVVSSCLNCFLSGGVLYRFEYAVNPALFLAKARGGTCTLAVTDPDEIVVHRAIHLLNHGFGCYSVFKKNCEDFAIYCKTGLFVLDQGRLGQSGQAVSYIGGPLAAALSTSLRLVTTNIFGMAATAVGVYCASRCAADIGMRSDVIKLEAEELTSRLERGTLLVVEEGSTALVVPSSTALEHFQWCLSLVQGRDTPVTFGRTVENTLKYSISDLQDPLLGETNFSKTARLTALVKSAVQVRDALVTFGHAVENTLKCSISDLQDPLLGETNFSKTVGLTALAKSALARWISRAGSDTARMRAFGKSAPSDHPKR